jgi:hypothetical protein
MDTDSHSIEAVKAKYETTLISIDGVESISIGIGKDGKMCLLIGLSLPVEDVIKNIPLELFSVPVEYSYIGNIHAQ